MGNRVLNGGTNIEEREIERERVRERETSDDDDGGGGDGDGLLLLGNKTTNCRQHAAAKST
jgi:hypothetical protein